MGECDNLFLSTSCFIRNISTSTKGIKRLSLNERKNILISNDIADILVGILLGDAHIARRSPTGNSRLMYTQSAVVH
jgi:hypothetical protein